MNDNVEIIRSNKGGMKIIHRGYMYTVHKKRQGGGIRWRCTQRSLHCKGSISTGNGPPSVNMPHNHIPDPHSVALARCRQLEEFPDINSLLETEYDEIKDSMPLQQRMLLNAPPQVQIPSSSESLLHSQPLSPTKLKVTRQVSKPQTFTPKPTETPPEEVCLRWNSHHSNMQAAFPQLLEKEQYVDVTIIAEGKTLKCHKMILSSCSSYFEEILNDITPLQHPVIILKGIPFWILKALIDFMYVGEVNIDQNKLPELLDVAELLKVKGLAGKSNNADKKDKQENQTPKRQQVKENGRQHTGKNPPQPSIVTKVEEMPISDPLELLEPKFQEDSDGTSSRIKDNKLSAKKTFTRKFRKRKTSEDEANLKKIISKGIRDTAITPKLAKFYEGCATPPLFPMRRGTRSRPNVKIPKYYDYEDIVKPTAADIQPFSPVVNIKSEPIDMEENDGTYIESAEADMDNTASKHSFLSSVGVNPKSLDKSLDKESAVCSRNRSVSRDKEPPPPMYKIKVKRFSTLSDNKSSMNDVPGNNDKEKASVNNQLSSSVAADDGDQPCNTQRTSNEIECCMTDTKNPDPVDEQTAQNDSNPEVDPLGNAEVSKIEPSQTEAVSAEPEKLPDLEN